MVLGATEEQELTAGRGRGRRLRRRGHRPGRGGRRQGGSRPRPPGQPLVLRFHRHPEGQDPRDVRDACNPATGKLRALPPLLDAPGHRRGVHPGRPRQTTPRTRPVADREGDRRRPRVRRPARPGGPSPGSSPCTPPTSPRRPRSSSSTSARIPRTKIGGKAKAMVVTSSRLHAVRYKQAIDALHRQAGLHDLDALVAFSGGVIDDKAIAYTEQRDERLPRFRDGRSVRRPTTTRC